MLVIEEAETGVAKFWSVVFRLRLRIVPSNETNAGEHDWFDAVVGVNKEDEEEGHRDIEIVWVDDDETGIKGERLGLHVFSCLTTWDDGLFDDGVVAIDGWIIAWLICMFDDTFSEEAWVLAIIVDGLTDKAVFWLVMEEDLFVYVEGGVDEDTSVNTIWFTEEDFCLDGSSRIR